MTATVTPAQSGPARDGQPAGQPTRMVVGAADTHKDFHHAAVVDPWGQHLGDQWFPATRRGYVALLAWLRGFGILLRVGLEGTGSYGAGLARYLAAEDVAVLEVNRPDKALRRAKGKSDVLDAYAAAEAAACGRAQTVPKDHTGAVESIRVLRETRAGAVKARTSAINTLKNLLTTAADDELHDQLAGLHRNRLITACAALEHDPDRIAEPAQATRAALRQHAKRIHTLDDDIATVEATLTPLVAATAPTTTALFGAGTDTVGQLLVTAGHNIDRLTSEAALAALCGVNPIPASSGRTDRHRLNRGGDRQANKALHQIILVRLRHDPTTRAYRDKRRQDGLATKDIIRCLKRYLVRDIYRALRADLLGPPPLDTQ